VSSKPPPPQEPRGPEAPTASPPQEPRGPEAPAAPPPTSPRPPASLWADRAATVPLEPPPPDPSARRSDLRAAQSPPDPSEVAKGIVAAAQAMHREGLVVATTGNVSARDGELIVRITPSGVPYDEMTPEDVVTLERSGWHSPRGRQPSSEHRMHLAIYRARDDVHAIVHTHSPHATAWSFLGEELSTGTEDLEHYVGGPVRTSRYEPSGSDGIGDAAVEALGDRRAALLARHGAVGVGQTLREALDACRVVERQAHIAWLLRP
jgi:L-fuculose-phosphate aldolase